MTENISAILGSRADSFHKRLWGQWVGNGLALPSSPLNGISTCRPCYLVLLRHALVPLVKAQILRAVGPFASNTM